MVRHDRLYGKLKFPNLINELLDCPGLLRLRDIGQANIPFFSYPSFANVSRYEHSLGVCHLANICAQKLELSEKERLELMIACLYHDVGTPAFAHAIEEVFNRKYGFDHEEHLYELILGSNRDIGKNRTQLYFGRSLKLEKVCQSSEARKIGIDIIKIAEIAIGHKNQYLSELVRSNSIDLDNIDNVIRGVSAMGYSYSKNLPIRLASSFTPYNNKFAYEEMFQEEVKEWLNLRKIMYKSIYNNIEDLSLQAMIKEAVRILIENEGAITIEDWRLTEDELIYNYLLKRKRTKKITSRFKLGLAYNCLIKLRLEGGNVKSVLKEKNDKINDIAYEVLYKKEDKAIKSKKKRITSDGEPILIISSFPDKSVRDPGRPFLFFNTEMKHDIKSKQDNCYYFFIFTSQNKEWNESFQEEFIDKIGILFNEAKIEKMVIDERYI